MNKYSILVVEDEALIAANLVQILSSLGYTVPEPVATGEDAIRAVKTQQPDLVLMDIKLIGAMDGIEAAEKIRAIADIPIVYLTAYTDNLRLKKAQLTEPYGYIVKPTHSRELHATIEMAMYKHALDLKLKESEDKYRTLIETTGTGFVFIDQDGLVLDANPEYVRLTGHHDLREIVGRSVIEWTADYEKEKNAAAIKTCFAKGSIRNLEIDYVDSKGNITPIEINATCIEIGGKTQTITICRDITERKRAEKALVESEELFATAFNSGPLMLAISDIDTGIYLNINDTFIRFTGYSRDEAIGKTSIELGCICPEDRESLLQELKRTGRVVGKEFRLTKKDGESGWYLFFGEIITVSGKKRLLSIAEDITERKRVEEELRVNEKRLEMAQEIGNIGCWEYDIKTNQMWGSREGSHLFGFPRMAGSFPIENFASCITEPEFVLKAFNDLINEGKEYDLDFIINPKDGSAQRTLHNIGRLEKDEQGNPIKVMGITQDITDRKRADAVLQESEGKYRTLFSGMPSGVAIYKVIDDGEDFIFRDFNTAGETIEHVRKEEVIGRRVTEVFPGVKEFGVFSVFQRVWRTGKPEYFPMAVYRNASDPGTWREIWTYKLPTGEIVSIYNDVTERKRAEEALAEIEKRYREIFDSSNDAIVIQDIAKGSILEVNKTMLEMYGYADQQEALKCTIEDLSALEEGYNEEKIKEMNRKTIDSNSNTFEWRAKKKNGEIFWAQVSLQRNSIGGVERILSTVHDITERKRADEALRKANKQLNLLSGITRHDILNQLLVLRGYLELSLDFIDKPEALKEYIKKADYVHAGLSGTGCRSTRMAERERRHQKRDGSTSHAGDPCRG
ncbi:MAG: PAS domain S-box protein [Methanoregula sp.]|nr:PAS domain S-box protein [Methanoregula sp.]